MAVVFHMACSSCSMPSLFYGCTWALQVLLPAVQLGPISLPAQIHTAPIVVQAPGVVEWGG